MSSSVSHVLLFPEDVDNPNGLDQATYGRVLSTDGSVATVQSLGTPSTTYQVADSLRTLRSVPVSEPDHSAAGEWLRKPVVGVENGRYVYGQVTEYSGDLVSIRTAAGCASSRAVDLQEVAPVICFLMAKAQLDTSVDDESLTTMHLRILDRLLGEDTGSSSARATRSVPRLMAGIIPTKHQPKPTDSRLWTNMATGRTSRVSCRHAIDYAHFVDGGRRPPASITLGSSFDDDPQFRDEAVPDDTATSPVADTNHPRDTHLRSDDLDTLLASVAAPTHQPALHAPPQHQSHNDDHHSRILAAIADDPNLVRTYLTMCANQLPNPSNKHTLTPDDPRPSRRARLESPADIISTLSNVERANKYSFQPTRVQQSINCILSSSEYAGKDPSALVDIMISSPATKFQPHPSIIGRLYSFEFGRRGLSIMHFTRFDFAAQRKWYAEGSVNLSNFSPSVPLPKALRPSSLTDLVNVFTVLHVFADEFMDEHTRRLINYSREFVEELRSLGTWGQQDVITVTFWFDKLFEQYRTATEHDSRNGTSTRILVRNELSLQNPRLQGTLYIIQSERLAALAPPPTTPQSRQSQPFNQHTRHELQSGRPKYRTPREVINALPRQGELSVCMKYLSARGCSSKSEERCAFPNHAHFLPDFLPQIVRDHINSKLGGVRRELHVDGRK